MSVTESRRLSLFEHARSTFGEEAAATLMDLLPPDHTELATKADLAVTKAELRADMADLRTEMADLRAEMHDGFARFDRAIAEQTRTLFLSMIGTMLVGISLAFAAAHIG